MEFFSYPDLQIAAFGFIGFLTTLQRMTIEDIRADTWFKKNYVALRRGEDENVSLDDVQAVFDNIEVCG
jgi:hypothetical protein